MISRLTRKAVRLRINCHRILNSRLAIYGSFVITAAFIILYRTQGQDQVVRRKHHESHSLNSDLLRREFVQLDKYCSSHSSLSTGEEGTVPDERLTLKSVLVITRHGDRSSLVTLKNEHKIIGCGPGDFKRRALLTEFQSKMRHESRSLQNVASQLRRLNVVPFSDACSPGDLTSLGVAQMIELGRFLRSRYNGKHWNLLKRKRWVPRDLNVTSTVYARTYQSMLAFLYGLLPQFSLSKLRIKATSHVDFCTTSFGCGTKTCRDLRESSHSDLHKFVDSRTDPDESDAFQTDVSKVVQVLANNTGHERTLADANFISPLTNFDVLVPYVCHQSDQMPCVFVNRQRRCIKLKDVERLREILYSRFGQLSKSSEATRNFFSFVVLAGKPAFERIRNIMHKLINGKFVASFHYLSGHDITIWPILQMFAVGGDEGLLPPYASRLVFEIYKLKDDGVLPEKKILVRMLFNGKDLTQFQPRCSITIPGDLKEAKKFAYTFCSLGDLNKIFNDALVKTGVGNFSSFC